MEQDQGLKKTMGLFTALSIVVGIVIGGGVFLNQRQYILQQMELQVLE